MAYRRLLATGSVAALALVGVFAASPGAAQSSAVGAAIAAKAVTAFGWRQDSKRDVVLRVAYALEPTPWANVDDQVIDGAIMLGRRRSSDWGWMRAALGPAWVIHAPGGQLEGSSTVGLAAQFDAVLTLGNVGAHTGWALGLTALTNLNSSESFVAFGVAVHVAR